MNKELLQFIFKNWLFLPIGFLVLFPLIPPKWLGLRNTYFDSNLKKEVPSQKYSIIRVIIHSLIIPIQEFLVIWSLRGTISIVIFAVIGADLIFRKQLSREAIILVSIGVIALYLEQLINRAKKIRIWKFFEWES